VLIPCLLRTSFRKFWPHFSWGAMKILRNGHALSVKLAVSLENMINHLSLESCW